ncbi:unnamed protein product [Paramecium octaurelia]|uniref:Uncharacterized protein n=1 Tax=Paramecium octaurelia TaxID=43137 RepID=A0A8S1WK75_PAROT|nr:unnamed protein product [Paramecium octaurelia]
MLKRLKTLLRIGTQTYLCEIKQRNLEFCDPNFTIHFNMQQITCMRNPIKWRSGSLTCDKIKGNLNNLCQNMLQQLRNFINFLSIKKMIV